MALKLTRGAVSVISSGNWRETDLKPILQVLEIRVIQSEYNDRYRLVLSDGLNNQPGVLATNLNDLVRSWQLQRGSIVRLNDFVTSNFRERVIIIIYGLDVIVSNCDISGELRRFSGFVPVAALNPYRDRWMIKVRVIAKAEFRPYRYAKRESNRAFSFDLADHTVGGGEIRAICFNDVGYHLYKQIEVGKVYFVSEGQIKPVKKASYDHRLKNDHEIRLDHSSTVWPFFDFDN